MEGVISEMDEFNSEWLLEEPSLSQTSNNSEVFTKSSFKKHSWLNEYFQINGSTTLCKTCEKGFKNRSCPRLFAHLKKCSEITTDNNAMMTQAIDMPNVNSMRNELWTEMIIENNIPLKCVESPSFKKFLSAVTKSWRPPSRQDISSVYIPKLSRKLQIRFSSRIEEGSIANLSIEFDHWTDANNRSLLGVIATEPSGKRYLVDLRDVSLKGHSADVIVEELVVALKSIPPKAINSIVSDSASACKKARLDILEREEYRHLIQHRCLAHLFNRIGSRITGHNDDISATIALSSKITSIISSSSHWSAHIKKLNMKKAKPACPVRWYSTVIMLDTLLNLKSVILEDIVPNLSNDRAETVRELDWAHLESILQILKPLNKCIGCLEKKDISLGVAFKEVLNYTKDLFAEVESPSEALIAARVSFLWHFHPKRIGREELGVYIAAYALNRSHCLRYLTEDGIDLALEAIARIGARSGVTLERVRSGLIDEFEVYRNFGDNYSVPSNDGNPAKWWVDRLGNGLLARIAIRLSNLRASSTNIERTFSTLRGIQGQSRFNLSISSLIDICRVKINTNVILDENDLEALDNDEQKTQANPLDSNESTSSIASEITPVFMDAASDWLEDQSPETIFSYKSFCKYIDFSITKNCNFREVPQSEPISEGAIKSLISSARASRERRSCGVTLDDLHEVSEYDSLVTLD